MRSRRVLVLTLWVALASAGCVSTSDYEAALGENEALLRQLEETRARLAAVEHERNEFSERFHEMENAYQRLDSRTEVLEEMVGTLRSMGACIRRLQIEVDEAEAAGRSPGSSDAPDAAKGAPGSG